MGKKESINSIEIVPLEEDSLYEAVEVFLEAFKKEAFTAVWLDLEDKRERSIYKAAAELKFKVYLTAGHPIFAAVENNRVVGLLVLKAPTINISAVPFIRLFLPVFPRIVGLIPLFTRAFFLRNAIKSPSGLPTPFYTLEAIAVHPAHQGKGVGRLLLEKAKDYCFANKGVQGIYLFTGEEKNRDIYERRGYKVLEVKKSRLLNSYHMFLKNEQ